MSNKYLLERSLKAVWHPCTQMKQHEILPLIPIARGEGIWLYDFDGKRYLDAIGSWWVNLFGHANPRINAPSAINLIDWNTSCLPVSRTNRWWSYQSA